LPKKSLSNATYARAVERHWSRKLGRAVVFSPRDYAVLSDWHLRGVPLQLVREVLDAALSRRARGRPLGLSLLSREVEEAWAVVSRGRLAEPATGPAVARPQPTALDRWRRRSDLEGPDTLLGALLRVLLERLDRGEDRAAIDGQMASELSGSVDPGRLARLREQLGAELAPYRARMDRKRLESTLDRACLARLREELDLPSLLDEETVV